MRWQQQQWQWHHIEPRCDSERTCFTSGKTSLETFCCHPPSTFVSFLPSAVAASCSNPDSTSGTVAPILLLLLDRSWPTTWLSRHSTRSWDLGSTPATGCTPPSTGWMRGRSGRWGASLSRTGRPSCPRSTALGRRQNQRSSRSPKTMPSGRWRVWPLTFKKKAQSLLLWTPLCSSPSWVWTMERSSLWTRRRTFLVSSPLARLAAPRSHQPARMEAPCGGATMMGRCRTWSGAEGRWVGAGR